MQYIQLEEYDASMGMNVGGWKGLNKRTSNGTGTYVKQNGDGHQMKQQWTLNGTMMDIGQNSNEHQT
jgi:hypothetical protein